MSEQSFSWEEAEARANHLLDLVGEIKNREFHYEVLMSAVRLAKDEPDRLDLKILNSAFKELRYSFRLFQRFHGRRKVACFGSARTSPGTELYELAERTARSLVAAKYMVITGAGPGVMEAANKGAGTEEGFGLAIRLPFEPEANRFVRADRLINFKYFFTRKLIFIKESDAFILFPGGFGTNDECFELLTLLQTGKADPCPVVLLDEPSGTYWESWMQFVRKELVGRGMIDDED
ncbi:MAG: LOG family protein, partial [Candidatus Eisenbacteria bacterium]